jgi:hypothetical protein
VLSLCGRVFGALNPVFLVVVAVALTRF